MVAREDASMGAHMLLSEHGDYDNHLLAPMLVRKKGVVEGGGRGRGDDMMKGRDRVNRFAKYCWDGEDGGSGHSLVAFGHTW